MPLNVQTARYSMIIPHRQLSREALQGILEAFVMREGTDYGEYEWSLAEKIAQLQQQLIDGDIVVVYDEMTESVSLDYAV